jgi:hypothetical protein
VKYSYSQYRSCTAQFTYKSRFLTSRLVLMSALLFSATALIFPSAALADGMPFKEAKPQPILTPLDKALEEAETKEHPLDIKPVEKVEQDPPPVEPAPTAEVPPVPESRTVEVQPDSSFFGLSVGMYDPFSHGEKAAAFNLEWQPGVKIAGVLQPLFGAMVTTQGSMLGYGGIGVPFNLTDHIFVMPSVAVGAYAKGRGYDLNRTLAFRIGSELAYQFDDKSRIGLNAHVISNGRSTNRDDRTEVISLVYTMPFDLMSSKTVPDNLESAAFPAGEAEAPPIAPATEATKPAVAAPNAMQGNQ